MPGRRDTTAKKKCMLPTSREGGAVQLNLQGEWEENRPKGSPLWKSGRDKVGGMYRSLREEKA